MSQKGEVHKDRGSVIDEIGGVAFFFLCIFYFEMYVHCSCFTNFDRLFMVYIL